MSSSNQPLLFDNLTPFIVKKPHLFELMSLERLLSPLAPSVIQIHATRFVPGLTVVCMEAQQKWVRIPFENLRHALHAMGNRNFSIFIPFKVLAQD